MRIGILGGGQLGRMLSLAGYPLGIETTILEPAVESSAAQVAPRISGEYDDFTALYQLVERADALTYEFENVPVESVRWLEERRPIYPPAKALAVAQDRWAEKTFFQSLGIPVPEFVSVNCREELVAGIQRIGTPAVLKTTRFGYDGKGQMTLQSPNDVENAWNLLGGRPLILEAFVPFQRELSIIAVRGVQGEMVFYPLVENHHREGMLRLTIAPAPNITPSLQSLAENIAQRVLNELNYVGVLAIELFEFRGELWVNEMAPRVHNSGHWTIEGAMTSQFANHMRAISGLPLGSTEPIGYSAMINLIGEAVDFQKILSISGASLHWYGKRVRANRKLGHITVMAKSEESRDLLIASVEAANQKREH